VKTRRNRANLPHQQGASKEGEIEILQELPDGLQMPSGGSYLEHSGAWR